jgi:hypothetical protein
VIYFFRRDAHSRSCETRLSATGQEYDLVITTDGEEYIETFETVAAMLAREHELLQAWRALGWRDVGTQPHADRKPDPRKKR